MIIFIIDFLHSQNEIECCIYLCAEKEADIHQPEENIYKLTVPLCSCIIIHYQAYTVED